MCDTIYHIRYIGVEFEFVPSSQSPFICVRFSVCAYPLHVAVCCVHTLLVVVEAQALHTDYHITTYSHMHALPAFQLAFYKNAKNQLIPWQVVWFDKLSNSTLCMINDHTGWCYTEIKFLFWSCSRPRSIDFFLSTKLPISPKLSTGLSESYGTEESKKILPFPVQFVQFGWIHEDMGPVRTFPFFAQPEIEI